jgi:hypothetical protein
MKMKIQLLKFVRSNENSVLREKFIAVNAYFRKEEKSKHNKLSFWNTGKTKSI